MDLRSWYIRQELFSVRSSRGRGIPLPSIILVGIGIVADPSDHEAREMVHQAGCFHLKADAVLPDVSENPVARTGVFDNYPAMSVALFEHIWEEEGGRKLGFDVRVLPDAMRP